MAELGALVDKRGQIAAELDDLIQRGDRLQVAMQRSINSDRADTQLRKQLGDEADAFIKSLPRFVTEYQPWYSEASSVVKNLLPDRISDFRRYYEKPTSRKEITVTTYTIEDFLHGVRVTRGDTKIVGPDCAISLFEQQRMILETAKRKLSSALFNIRQLVQADIFDCELEAARSLLEHGFFRAAGAMAGVVLERHLRQVASTHNVNLKAKPTISDSNDRLKNADVYDIPQWRKIQHLADIRNLCDHASEREPTKDEVSDLIAGAEATLKNVS